MFPSNLLATEMFRVSRFVESGYKKRKAQTIFDKFQKPAEQVLITRKSSQEYLFTLVSAAEARFLKTALYQFPCENVWLVSSNGRPFVRHANPLDITLPEVAKGLSFLSIFGGRASAIEEIPGGQLYFQMWLELGGGTLRDRSDFVVLHSLRSPGIDQLRRLTKNITSETVIGLRHELTPDQVSLEKDPEKIFLFGNNEIPYVIPEQVPFLRAELLHLVKELSLIQAVPLEKLSYLSSSSYASLSIQQVLFFSHESLIEKILLLPKEALSSLTKEDFLNPENAIFFNNLSEQQQDDLTIQLTLEEVLGIVKSGLKSFSSLSRFLRNDDFPNLEPKYIPTVGSALCKHFTTAQLNYLSERQVAGLSDTTIIQRLPGKLLKFLDLRNTRDLSDSQVAQWGHQLTLDQLAELSPSQIQAIDNPDVIQILPAHQIKDISADAVKDLSEEQITSNSNLLTPDQLARLSETQIGLVKTSESIHRLSGEQLPYVDIETLSLISDEQLKSSADRLKDEQLARLSARQIKILEDESVINRLSPEKLREHLTPEQITKVDGANIKHLGDEQIKHLATTQISLLPVKKLNLLAPDQFRGLDKSQVPHVGFLNIKFLEGKQIKDASLWQTLFMKVSQFSEMRKTQKIIFVIRSAVVLSIACFAAFWIYNNLRKSFFKDALPNGKN